MSRNSRGGAAWQKTRLMVLERDGYRCAWCGREADTVDHVQAVANKGGDQPWNLVACCRVCNGRKSDRILVRLDWFNAKWLDI